MLQESISEATDFMSTLHNTVTGHITGRIILYEIT